MNALPKYQPTFKKEERLISKKLIGELIENGTAIKQYPFKITYHKLETEENWNFPVKILISIPKRIFKKAVERNLLKRRIKESYRKRKSYLYEVLNNKNVKLTVMIVYLDKEIKKYNEIDKEIGAVIDRLCQQL